LSPGRRCESTWAPGIPRIKSGVSPGYGCRVESPHQVRAGFGEPGIRAHRPERRVRTAVRHCCIAI